MPLEVDILSLFPEFFDSPLRVSILKRAQEKGLLTVRTHNVRDYAEGKHRKVDDRPFGGGPGMIMKPEPISRAIQQVKREDSVVVYLSPQGQPLTPQLCEAFAQRTHLVLLCGHYEGVDERVIQLLVDMEVSVGDYVLTSGCPAALVLLDASVRFIPGTLGSEESARNDSFQPGRTFDAPQYTKPDEFLGVAVPEVLKSGHHQKIDNWRAECAQQKLQKTRPDLV